MAITLTHDVARMEAVVAIADNGVGIEPRVRAHIFDDFFTTKATGSGLGLGFARRVAEAHGGRIMVHGAPGRGTTVTFVLPMTTTPDEGLAQGAP